MNTVEWFTGVVEDIFDPLEMNRVRVRCFGYHTHDKALIRTEDLPWATIMLPTTSAGMSGLGTTPHGLLQGSWVVGFFRDGKEAQDPIIMGAIASSMDEKPNVESGFADPAGDYPKEDYVGESDVNRLARSQDTETKLVENKNNSITKSVPTANGANSTWDEPESPYAAEYPFNKVVQTISGHVFETDDTENAERIHEYHKSGTFREIHPDGTIVTRIVGDDYVIVAKDNNVNIKGNVNLTIDENCTTYVKKDWNIQVDGNMNVNVAGYKTETVTGEWTRNSETHIVDNAPRIDHN